MDIMNLQDNIIITALVYKNFNEYSVQGLEYDIKLSKLYSLLEAKSKFLEAISKQVLRDLSCKSLPLEYYDQAARGHFEQAILAKQSGPELPVYLPIQRKSNEPHLRIVVRFLEVFVENSEEES